MLTVWAAEGDLDAARQLVLSHLRFVVHIARGYSGYGLPLGDVANPYQLKHVSNHEARVVQHNLLHPGDLRATDHRFVPSAVFTSPQIASVGMTQQESSAVLGVLVLYPLFQGIFQSFTDLNETNSRDVICTKTLGGGEECADNPDRAQFVGLDNYADVLTDAERAAWFAAHGEKHPVIVAEIVWDPVAWGVKVVLAVPLPAVVSDAVPVRVFRLEETADAFRYLQSQAHFGKVVISIVSPNGSIAAL